MENFIVSPYVINLLMKKRSELNALVLSYMYVFFSPPIIYISQVTTFHRSSLLRSKEFKKRRPETSNSGNFCKIGLAPIISWWNFSRHTNQLT